MILGEESVFSEAEVTYAGLVPRGCSLSGCRMLETERWRKWVQKVFGVTGWIASMSHADVEKIRREENPLGMPCFIPFIRGTAAHQGTNVSLGRLMMMESAPTVRLAAPLLTGPRKREVEILCKTHFAS
jgi:hypothetical protein